MKNNSPKRLRSLLLLLGLCPFAAPLLLGIHRVLTESWAFLDWIVLWSYVYWPTCVAGLVLILLAVFALSTGRQTGRASRAGRAGRAERGDRV